MKLLITGCNGQLGAELNRILKSGISELGEIPREYAGAQVICVDIDDLDITDAAAVPAYIDGLKPDIIFNCAAFTNVDKCETEYDTAYAVNAAGVKNIAAAAQSTGAKLVHVSTDYVFAGDAHKPYCESDSIDPQTAYGVTKAAGERFVSESCKRHFIVRTAWLYGYAGKNFVRTIMRAGREKGALTVVNDQFGNPTNAADLAYSLLKLALTDAYGTYHCTGRGICSWYDFACAIIEYAGIDAAVSPCTTAEYPSRTKRPAYSALDNTKLAETVGDCRRDWREALRCFIADCKGE